MRSCNTVTREDFEKRQITDTPQSVTLCSTKCSTYGVSSFSHRF